MTSNVRRMMAKSMTLAEALAIARKWHGEARDRLGEDYVNGHLAASSESSPTEAGT